jgi:D-alanyl-D-alanine dipeptidase
MHDTISIPRIQELHPAVRPIFEAFITACEAALGVRIRITQGWRSTEAQQHLYEQGRTRPGKIVTHAPGGSSYHNYGLAVDLAVLSPDGAQVQWDYDMATLTPMAQKYGLEWGGDWKSIKDRPHFQKSFGLTVHELQERVRQGLADSEGYVCIS